MDNNNSPETNNDEVQGEPVAESEFSVVEGGLPSAHADKGEVPIEAHDYYNQGNMPAANIPDYALYLMKNDIRKKEAAKSINHMALLSASQTGLMYLWQQVLIMVMGMIGIGIFALDLNYFWMLALLVPLATLLPFAIYLIAAKPDIQGMIRFEHRDAVNTVFGVIIGFGMCLLANIPANYVRVVLGMFGYSSESPSPTRFDLWECLLYFLGVAILAPIIEEFVFRGIILSKLERHGKGFALFVSALIFGMAHTDFVSVIFAFLAGLVFGWLYIKTRNLWIPIFVHFLNNALSIFQTYSSFWFGEQTEIINNLSQFLPIVLTLVCLVFMLIFHRKQFFTLSEAGDNQPEARRYFGISYFAYPLRGGETISALVRAPGFWIMAGLVLYGTAQYFLV